MDGSNIYIISYAWYEDYVPTVMIGPAGLSEADLKAICDPLVPEAARCAIAAEQGQEHMRWVGWLLIQRHLVKLLEGKGFVVIGPVSYGVWGSNIIDSERDADNSPAPLGDALPEVIAHNKAVEAWLKSARSP